MATVTLITSNDTISSTVPQDFDAAISDLTRWGWVYLVGNTDKAVLHNEDNWSVVVEK